MSSFDSCSTARSPFHSTEFAYFVQPKVVECSKFKKQKSDLDFHSTSDWRKRLEKLLIFYGSTNGKTCNSLTSEFISLAFIFRSIQWDFALPIGRLPFLEVSCSAAQVTWTVLVNMLAVRSFGIANEISHQTKTSICSFDFIIQHHSLSWRLQKSFCFVSATQALFFRRFIKFSVVSNIKPKRDLKSKKAVEVVSLKNKTSLRVSRTVSVNLTVKRQWKVLLLAIFCWLFVDVASRVVAESTNCLSPATTFADDAKHSTVPEFKSHKSFLCRRKRARERQKK